MKGPGTSWEFTFPDGITERYAITGVRPFEELEDDVESLFVWAWSLKDYIKTLTTEHGRDPEYVENLVNCTPALCIVADVANRLKHGTLTRSRSGHFPRLAPLQYSIPGGALKSLVFSSEGVTIEPADPQAVELSFSVLDRSGQVVGDAIVLLESAITELEGVLPAI